MSVFVYRAAASQGARQLAEALDGRRIRQAENLVKLIRSGDTLICWGSPAPAGLPRGLTILNGSPIRSKLTDIQVLTTANVKTVTAALQRPVQQRINQPDPILGAYRAFLETIDDWPDVSTQTGDLLRSPVAGDSLAAVVRAADAFQQARRVPAPVPVDQPDLNWVGRKNDHVGGLDLLNPSGNPDYWVRKETITEEYRLHIFDGKSIRAGKKAHRRDFTGTRSDWVRSYDGGWKIVYDKYESTAAQKALAVSAVKALGLTFGAVDLGLLSNGDLIVLEVNRAPGLEGGTIEAYARAIERFEEGQGRVAA